MKNFLVRLNLRPQELRLVVVVGAIVFILLNYLLIWPRFKDWGAIQEETRKTRGKLQAYRSEIARTQEYQEKLATIEKEGAVVLPEDQATRLQSMILSQAAKSKFVPTGVRPAPKTSQAQTNQFFEEQTVIVGVNTGDKELVDFLVALGSGDSMIRVRDLDLRPDPSTQTKLIGQITLVASYQKNLKKPAGRPATKTAALANPAKKRE